MAISFRTGQRLFFFTLLAATTLFFLWMVRDYLFPVFWAIVFALLLHPTYQWLQKNLRNDVLAALSAMLFALLIVILPISWLGSQVAREAYALYQSIALNGGLSAFTLPGPLLEMLATFGFEPGEVSANIAAWAETASAWIFSEALSISGATFSVVLKTFIMLYLLFFILRDGEKLGAYIMRYLPLGDDKERALFARFATTTRAVMKGTIVVALAQGAVGGIVFWMAGIDNPVLWGAVMAFLSVIPAVGPILVWLPAGLILLATGSFVPALIVLIGGGVVISSIDNFLRPVLLGRETKMPDALILISILGGISVFGIAGVVIGPVVSALVITVWDIFAEEFRAELSAHG